jgi:predicted O-methyltransferase YrrM
VIEPNDWSLTPAALESVASWIGPERESIVECGSGLSTVVIARLLRERGSGSLYALEHDPAWARQTRDALEREALADWARVIDAPLRADPLAQPGCPWYDRASLTRLPQRIDLLLVDGPPAGEPKLGRSRYPALPALAPRLAPGAVVILDDIQRPGERWVLGRWEAEHAIRFAVTPEAGVAIGVCSGQVSGTANR